MSVINMRLVTTSNVNSQPSCFSVIFLFFSGTPSDYGGSEDSRSPSIEEMKANMDLMNRLMAESVKDLEKGYSFSHCNYGVF